MREDYFEEEEEDQVNLEKRKSYFYDIFLWLGLITTKRKRSLEVLHRKCENWQFKTSVLLVGHVVSQ